MFKKALVPLDFTDVSEGILPYVGQLARGLEMPLVLLSVIDPESVEMPDSIRNRPRSTYLREVPEGGYGAASMTVTSMKSAKPVSTGTHPHETGGTYASQIFETAEEDVKAHLETKAKELRETGLTVDVKVTFGRAAEEIVKSAEAEGADLIAMSTRGRGTLSRGVLGSVTDKVAHIAHMPVLTITPERAKEYWQEGEPMSRIMVPLDGSELAETALPYVERLARLMKLAVVLVRVVKIGGIYSAYTDGYPYTRYVDLENEIEEEATDYLKIKARHLRAKGLMVEWKVLRGGPTASIVDLARETPQDLIAMSTHGRSGVTRWFLGSVTEGLVRSSGDPVLVIPPVEAE